MIINFAFPVEINIDHSGVGELRSELDLDARKLDVNIHNICTCIKDS